MTAQGKHESLIMEKRWNILQANPEMVDSLHSALKINKTLCKILVQRGINGFDSAKNFFRPSLQQLHDPWLMKDMRKAVDRMGGKVGVESEPGRGSKFWLLLPQK